MHQDQITVNQCKDTGLAIILIDLLLVWAHRSIMLVLPAVVILILTMTAPKLLMPFARVWFGFSHYLGKFVSMILFSIIFIAIVTPVGLIRKFSGKDAMGLAHWRAGRQSTFLRRDHVFTPSDLEKPF
jgi:hypothetical protein